MRSIGARLAVFVGVIGCAATLEPASGDLPKPPERTRIARLSGNAPERITLGRLEPGRVYRVRLDLASSPFAGSRLQAHLEGTAGHVEMTADRWERGSVARIRPESRDPVRVVVDSLGEPGEPLAATVSWQAEAEPRMTGVEYVPSPNQNERSAAARIDTVVVHATVTPTTEATVEWFLTPRSQVSAHYVVGRDGRIVQMVDDTSKAWHAGVSEMEGVKGVNDFSVGIEIVNLNDGKDAFTDAQYEAVAAIIRHIRDQYDVPDSRIVSHEHVARPVGRKSDPKGFDFPRLVRLSRNPQ